MRKAELIEELKKAEILSQSVVRPVKPADILNPAELPGKKQAEKPVEKPVEEKRASRKEKRRFTPMCLRRIIIQEITEGVIYPPTVITTITREIIIRTTITRTTITRTTIIREIITRTTIIIQMPKIIPIILLRIIHRMTMDLPKCCRSISRTARLKK